MAVSQLIGTSILRTLIPANKCLFVIVQFRGTSIGKRVMMTPANGSLHAWVQCNHPYPGERYLQQGAREFVRFGGNKTVDLEVMVASQACPLPNAYGVPNSAPTINFEWSAAPGAPDASKPNRSMLIDQWVFTDSGDDIWVTIIMQDDDYGGDGIARWIEMVNEKLGIG